ncbi:Gfo/Idh/MocA family oxidoreductase [Leifsonia sp. NPDC080035]|uniref:Gfo/Idh/MocA family oxidoreductase n=1 Tax=Leifsonia sp. NPDC080035 TaxID=3143936 RepID=A0AAU7GJB7_9MICO
MSTPSTARSHAVAVVGAGRMGAAHAAAWAACDVPVRWVVSPRRRPELAAAPDAAWATTLDEALADPAVTIVSVCTPTPTHADLATDALAAGRNVLLEKPIALTLEDAERVASAAASATGILMVAHVVRFTPGYAALADRVAAGSVGRPRAVRAARLSAAPAGSAWLADEERSGGMVVDFAIHDVDQANLLLGTPVAVTATAAPGAGGGFGAPAAITVEYGGGGVAQLFAVSDLPDGTRFRTSLEVVGESGVDAMADLPGDPFEAQARYLLACIADGTPPLRAPVGSAVEALRVCLAAAESLRTGRRIPLAGMVGP